ncbi:hypothetical protein GCM10010435_52410 [Winogradskya consettensis]|uniref:HNH nuclease domain-containing protein n=1 Tax=Winogradskya consettensis TaxID=113560 RepID=A0A919SH53_9ACTN|nr:HNH endonuclease [Actinoplanes consettensis]GIM71780.1 hypothetical protein Aco04nite_27030 [Actinoplanes consettensis]
MAKARYTQEVLKEAVIASTSMAGVMRHLGLRPAGGTHAHLRRRIDQLGIDSSHFTGQSHAHNRPSSRRRRPEEVMIERPTTRKREAPHVLRRALTESGRPCRCADCGNGGEWQGRPMTLQVDHINGMHWDCRADNLRFLCPNCHSQTRTFAGRNRFECTYVVEGPITDEIRIDVITRVNRGEISAAAASRLLKCAPWTIRQYRDRLTETGGLKPPPRKRGVRPTTDAGSITRAAINGSAGTTASPPAV